MFMRMIMQLHVDLVNIPVHIQRIHIRMYVFLLTPIYIHIYNYTDMYMCIYILYIQDVHKYIHACMHIRMYVHMLLHIHIHVYIYI